jgi:hypothetical protein
MFMDIRFENGKPPDTSRCTFYKSQDINLPEINNIGIAPGVLAANVDSCLFVFSSHSNMKDIFNDAIPDKYKELILVKKRLELDDLKIYMKYNASIPTKIICGRISNELRKSINENTLTKDYMPDIYNLSQLGVLKIFITEYGFTIDHELKTVFKR